MRLTVGLLADLGNWAGTISAVAQIRYCPLSTSEGGGARGLARVWTRPATVVKHEFRFRVV